MAPKPQAERPLEIAAPRKIALIQGILTVMFAVLIRAAAGLVAEVPIDALHG